MKTRSFILLLVIIQTLPIAQDFKKTATAGFVFLQLPVTARGAALGESSVSLAEMGGSSVFSNLAGMGLMTSNTHLPLHIPRG